MSSYSGKIVVYQVNTWVWLDTLTRQHAKTITLANVPDSALDELVRPGVDIIWLMGVWQRSPFGRQNALKYKHEYRPVLPDLTDDDVIGSAYAIYDYRVDDRIGKREGLEKLRRRLRERGLGLMLDFVPNHVAADHRWTRENPDYIVQGRPEDLKNRPSDFYKADTILGDRVLAHGKDPYFPGWSDTAQLNVFNPALRLEMVATLRDIAAQCDGVRCDMAMLLFNEIFSHTWRGHVGEKTAEEFWREIIPQIKAEHPNFLFVAEVYWNREYEILLQGFDYAYDKLFYDRVIAGDVTQLRSHLLASIDYQRRLMRFIENHDEQRASAALGHKRTFAAATLICTIPGAALLHEGQLVGRTKKLPVQIKRQPDEPAQKDLEGYYLKLLQEIRDPIYHNGKFYLFHVHSSGGEDRTHNNLLAYGWHEPGKDYRLIVVNLTPTRSYGRINLGVWGWLANHTWRLYDVTDDAEYTRHGGELTSEGLFIDLDPFESHVFRFVRAEQPDPTRREPIPVK
jgi:hypothetical protein